MKIIVIGSANMDLVIQTARIPEAGETIHGNGFFLSAGGKGANQAVASARMGAETWLMGKVGDDIFGRSIRDKLVQFGVRGEYLTVESGVMTGVVILTTYGLVLASMAYVTNVSYVAAFRQLSIPIGAVLGFTLQQEPRYLPKLMGIGIVTVGLVLVGTG